MDVGKSTSSNLYPPNQRDNLLHLLEARIKVVMEENDITQDRAFLHVSLDALGYPFEPSEITDGKGDSGIDFIQIEPRRATIFQFKSQEFSERVDPEYKIPPSLLGDLGRIATLLANLDDAPAEVNAKVRSAMKELKGAIERHSKAEDRGDESYKVDVYFVALARAFSSQAREEYDRLCKSRRINWGEYHFDVTFYPVLLDDILAERWRESNAEWKTADGKKDEHITLHVSGDMITGPKSCVFFTKAIDLVEAFDRFGYQMFEPNVRCELRRSRVNEAIRASVKSARGRREFKHLNNGITLICASFGKKRVGGDEVEGKVRQPGVINGLQTVKSIHDAYDELQSSERAQFADYCDILVRLHTRDAVHDYKELVKSTNNQNPMQPRNLRSNDSEQLEFERLFAEMGWFYERKEGAWQAYRSDHSLWGSLRGFKSTSFKSPRTGNVRFVDNLDLSQSWLSFLGFSDQAIHNKRDIFSDDRYYDAIFRYRLSKHGYDYGFKFLGDDVRAEATLQSPSPQMLLISALAYEMASHLTPSRRQNRDEAIKRLKMEKARKEEQDAALSEDPVYIKGLVLAGAKYLFAEFCGLLLFRSIGAQVHNAGAKLLSTKSAKPIFIDYDFEPLKKAVRDEDFENGDFFAIAWGLYNFCLEQMIGMHAWRQEFQQAAVRSRFNYSEFNRRELYKQLEQLDKVYQKRAHIAPWSQGFENSKGIFNYFRTLM